MSIPLQFFEDADSGEIGLAIVRFQLSCFLEGSDGFLLFSDGFKGLPQVEIALCVFGINFEVIFICFPTFSVHSSHLIELTLFVIQHPAVEFRVDVDDFLVALGCWGVLSHSVIRLCFIVVSGKQSQLIWRRCDDLFVFLDGLLVFGSVKQIISVGQHGSKIPCNIDSIIDLNSYKSRLNEGNDQ